MNNDKKEDHVSIGRRLDLFINEPNVGKGLPLLTPRGTTIKRVLQRFVEDEELGRGYEHTSTPMMARNELYKMSGHWDLYRDHMFVLEPKGGDARSDDRDSECLALRPMTCPFHFYLYKRKLHSYRDLPVRYAETSTLFRNEDSGAMHGLIRIRQFTLSDGHIICTREQVESEFLSAFNLVRYVFDVLGLEGYWYQFSRRGDSGKYIDNPRAWDESEMAMQSILAKSGVEYVEATDEAAFYGPKLDIQMRNVWGKEDTIFTLQLDFALPERFALSYLDSDGNERTPFVIHRSSIGCYERTIAMLLEQFSGDFPLWLAPEQVRILTVSDASETYGSELLAACLGEGLRASADYRNETLGRKIRDSRLMQIPLTVIVGEKEQDNDTVSARLVTGENRNGIPREAFVRQCRELDRNREKKLVLEQL